MRVVGGKVEDENSRMASPGDARSLSALMLCAKIAYEMGITLEADELQTSMEVLIEQSKGRMAPRSYDEVAVGAMSAYTEYRRRMRSEIIDAQPESENHA